MRSATMLTPAEAISFHRKGYFVVENVLGPGACARYIRTLQSAMEFAGGPHGSYRYGGYANQSRLDRVLDLEPFQELIDLPAVIHRMRTLIGEAPLRIIDHIALSRRPGAPQTGWHGQGRWPPMYQRRGGRFAALLVKASVNLTAVDSSSGGLRVGCGTHRALVPLPHRAAPPHEQAVLAPAGSVTIFSDGLQHCAGANFSQVTRYAVIIGYGPAILKAWPGFTPREKSPAALTDARRRLMTGEPSWCEWPDDELALYDRVAGVTEETR